MKKIFFSLVALLLLNFTYAQRSYFQNLSATNINAENTPKVSYLKNFKLFNIMLLV